MDLPSTVKRERLCELNSTFSQLQGNPLLSTLHKNIEQRIRSRGIPVIELESTFAVLRAFDEVLCSVGIVIIRVLAAIDGFQTEE